MEFEDNCEKWIKEEEVETFRQTIVCRECGGEVKWTGSELTSNPPWYEHCCNGCGWEVSLRDHFPRTRFRRI
jgi:hypothetical protein